MDDGLDSKTIGLGMAWALSQGGAVLELCWNCVGTVLELCWKKNKLPLFLGVLYYLTMTYSSSQTVGSRVHPLRYPSFGTRHFGPNTQFLNVESLPKRHPSPNTQFMKVIPGLNRMLSPNISLFCTLTNFDFFTVNPLFEL